MNRPLSYPSADDVPVRLALTVITSPDKKVLIFGAEKEKLNGMWRKTYNGRLQNLFFEVNIVTELWIFFLHIRRNYHFMRLRKTAKILIIVVDGTNKILNRYLYIRGLVERNIIR
jgi:hypothetical protein